MHGERRALRVQEHVDEGPFQLAALDLGLELVAETVLALRADQAEALRAHEDHRVVADAEAVAVEAEKAAERGLDLGHAVLEPRDLAAEDVLLADEGGDEGRLGVEVDLVGRADLLDPAVVHHRDPVGHGQGLALVVGDEDEGDAGLALDLAQLRSHVLAQLEVEGGERLVEQQHRGLDRQGPGDGDALALPAGQLGRLLAALAAEVDQGQELLRALAPRRLVDAAGLQAEGDVLPDRHQREERQVLEDQGGRPVVGAAAAHVLAADQDLAFRGLDEARDHPQDRGLAAARGPEDGKELPGLDLQVAAVDGREVAEAHDRFAELDVFPVHARPRFPLRDHRSGRFRAGARTRPGGLGRPGRWLRRW